MPSFPVNRVLAFWLCMTGSALPAGAAELISSAERNFFENRIRPALVKYCYECHSAKAKKIGGKLLLDSRKGLLTGGESGPVIIPGRPNDSLLIQSLRYEDTEMPPDQPLPPAVVRDFARWVEMGAPDPRSGDAPPSPATKEGELHWSLRPVRDPTPGAVRRMDWARDRIDRFVLARMEAEGLTPTSDAPARTLARRLYYDLIGLPPTLGQIEAFAKAHRKNARAATEALVDELLASPHFGERWGRHWLDVARYGESNGNDGLARNPTFPHAWRYRDYVIRAFNRDTPYNRFIQEQIAGDLLPATTDLESDWNKVATGFLALCAKPAKAMNVNFDMDVVADQIAVVGSGIMGLSVGCARCHDHKHDPIPTRDYYALAGIFKSTTTMWGAAANEKLTAPATPLHQLKVLRRPDRPVPDLGIGVPEFAPDYEDAIRQLKPVIYSKLDRPHPDLKPEDGATMTPEKRGHSGKNGRIRGVIRKPIRSYSVSFWFRNDLKSDSVIMTAYLFSFANRAKHEGAGDHLGISGTYKGARPGRLFVFPGSKKTPSVRGATQIPEHTWNHVVLVRDGRRVRVQLNGNEPLEIDSDLEPSFGEVSEFTLGARSDKLFPLRGNITEFAFFDRALSREEAMRLHSASGQPRGSGPKLPGPITRSPDNLAMGVRDAPNPDDCRININGESQKLGPWVPRGFLTAWSKPRPPIPVPPDKQPRPLFARALSVTATTTGKPKWKLEKGILSSASKANERGFVVTREKFRDFDLSCEFELKGKGRYNSGISFRVGSDPGKAPHFNLGDAEAGEPIGLFLNDWLARSEAGLERDQWNRLRLRVVGQHVEGWINDEKLVDYRLSDKETHEGAIAFQSAGYGKDDTGSIRFRKLMVQRLNPTERPYSPIRDRRKSGRLELARWLTDRNHPLTARVFVNRVWHHLMGQPIVATPDDFGVYGARPTHPDLLDHLATRFMEGGWSVKRLIRDIVLTRTYGLDSNCDSRTRAKDPDNHLLARHNRRRLDAESFRDSVLAVTGALDRQPGIGSDVQYLDVLVNQTGGSLHRPSHHRSVYLCMLRNSPPPDLAAFDLPDGREVKGRRDVTDLPTQSLYLLNSPFVVKQSEALASRLLEQLDLAERDRVKHAYLRVLAREPDASEIARAIALVRALEGDLTYAESHGKSPELRAWAGLCQALLLTNEFRYVD